MSVQIQFRRDTQAAWASADPTLSAGEPGFEMDTDRFKLGDGSTAWTSLPYYSNDSATDHGSLSGRDDDDHTLYIKADGTRAFSAAVTGVTPTSGGHLSTKDYVDGLINGLDWQGSVISIVNSPPGGESGGERHIVGTSGSGAFSGHNNEIAEYDGGWSFTAQNEGFATWVEGEDVVYTWNGAAWVKFGSTVDHGNLTGKDDDDHTQYLLASGARNLGGNWNISTYTVGDGTGQFAYDAGDIKFSGGNVKLQVDSKWFYAGASDDAWFGHDGTDSRFGTTKGDLRFENNSDGDNIVFRASNESAVNKTLLELDPDVSEGQVEFLDNSMRMVRSATDVFLYGNLGDMTFRNLIDGSNMIFQADNAGSATKTLLTLNPDTETATVGGTCAATTVTGANVTSGADPGHTHTAYSGTGHAHALGDLSDVTATAEGTGGGFDADTVDSLHASSFIRSNANDNVTGHTEWQDTYQVRVGNSADGKFYHNGTNTYIDNATGILYIRNLLSSDSDVRMGAYHDSSYKVFLSIDGSADAMILRNPVMPTSEPDHLQDGMFWIT